MASKRGNPAHIGNYMQRVDPAAMDDSMQDMMFGTKMNKTEKSYVKGTGRSSSVEAVRRARKANKQPRLRPEV